MLQIIDAIGQEFEPAAWRRVVSLVPSLTETLFAYGVGESVVGVTRYCVEPGTAIATLPKIGGTKNPDLAAIRDLSPDLVIASVEENRKEDVEALIAAGLCVFVTLPETVAAALQMLTDTARLLQADDAARPMLLEVENTLAEVQAAAARVPAVRYFCPIWRRPYMTSGPGTYAYDLLRVCGGESVCAAGVSRYYSVELADVAAGLPEVILLPDEPYPFAERHKAEFAAYPEMPAVGSGAIHCIDGKLITWYGPRTAPGLRLVQRLLREAGPPSPRPSPSQYWAGEGGRLR